jgi:hypothetical protein
VSLLLLPRQVIDENTLTDINLSVARTKFASKFGRAKIVERLAGMMDEIDRTVTKLLREIQLTDVSSLRKIGLESNSSTAMLETQVFSSSELHPFLLRKIC